MAYRLTDFFVTFHVEHLSVLVEAGGFAPYDMMLFPNVCLGARLIRQTVSPHYGGQSIEPAVETGHKTIDPAVLCGSLSHADSFLTTRGTQPKRPSISSDSFCIREFSTGT